MALMGALGLGIYKAPPAPNRSFPVYNLDGSVVYPQFAYPLRKEVVPIWLAALLAFFVPWFFFTLFQIRRRSLNDYLTTNMGLLKSLITAAVFQVWIKWLIGGLRPHFYDVCKPNVAQGPPTGIGFAGLMYDRRVCTGDKKQINDSLESFPSGHATAAFAGFIYLSLYFNAQLKVISAHNPAYWKMILFFCPILGATLIAGALTIDEFHNWYDVLFGAAIGTCTALVAFRQTFASTFDFRFNHILLPRTTSLFHRTASSSATSLGGQYYTYDGQAVPGDGSFLPFTREAGWGGDQEAFVGAPGDATVLMAGGAGAMGRAGGFGAGGMGTGAMGSGAMGSGAMGTGAMGTGAMGPGMMGRGGHLGQAEMGQSHRVPATNV
jgi:membrane-associated phospholipid phosphatase